LIHRVFVRSLSAKKITTGASKEKPNQTKSVGAKIMLTLAEKRFELSVVAAVLKL